MMVNRRALLTLISGSGSFMTAGCLADETTRAGVTDYGNELNSVDADIEFDDPENYPINVRGERSIFDFNAEERVFEEELGEDEVAGTELRPHGVQLLNATESPVIFDFLVYDSLNEHALHRDTYRVPQETEGRFSLMTPSLYLLHTRLPEVDIEQTLQVPCNIFDCNSSVTHIGLFPNHELNSLTFTTEVLCRETFTC